MSKPFLPEGYQAPKQSGGHYMKLQDGANKFRILSEAITGYELWTADNKPVRFRDYPEKVPANIRPDSKIKHFWAFAVWNYGDSAVQILEITQSTILAAITDLLNSEDWGDPRGYDITVNRKGEKLDTEYTTQPAPHKEAGAAIREAYDKQRINLNALFDGGDPFEVPGEELVKDADQTHAASAPWRR